MKAIGGCVTHDIMTNCCDVVALSSSNSNFAIFLIIINNIKSNQHTAMPGQKRRGINLGVKKKGGKNATKVELEAKAAVEAEEAKATIPQKATKAMPKPSASVSASASAPVLVLVLALTLVTQKATSRTKTKAPVPPATNL